MVGNLSRYFVGKSGSRRSHSAVDGREALPENTGMARATSVGGVASTNGIEIGGEFKPVVHPTEPLNKDGPMQCPLLESSLANDGITWKERISGGLGSKEDLPIMQKESPAEPEVPKTRPHSRPPLVPRMISPSNSATEHIIQAMEESRI